MQLHHQDRRRQQQRAQFHRRRGGKRHLDIGAQTVQETGFSLVAFTGVDTANVANGTGAVTVEDTASGNTLAVTPKAANSSSLQVSGQPLLVNVTASASPLNVNLAANDALLVNGSQYNDAITVTGTQVADTETSGPAATLQTITYSGAASLTVNGNGGNDTFTVTPGATPILVEGALSGKRCAGVDGHRQRQRRVRDYPGRRTANRARPPSPWRHPPPRR